MFKLLKNVAEFTVVRDITVVLGFDLLIQACVRSHGRSLSLQAF